MQPTPPSKRFGGKVPTTVWAVGAAVVIVGGFWAVVGAAPYFGLMERRETTPLARQDAPPDPRTALYDPAQPRDHVTYKHFSLYTSGKPVSLPTDKMVYLGRSDEGYGLWTYPPQSGEKPRTGGGGGPLAPRAVPQALGPVYLREPGNMFQMVIQKP